MSGGFGVGEVCTVASSVTMVGLVVMPVIVLDLFNLFDLSASSDNIVACNLFAARVLSRVQLLAAEMRCTSGCAGRCAAGKL